MVFFCWEYVQDVYITYLLIMKKSYRYGKLLVGEWEQVVVGFLFPFI